MVFPSVYGPCVTLVTYLREEVWKAKNTSVLGCSVTPADVWARALVCSSPTLPEQGYMVTPNHISPCLV